MRAKQQVGLGANGLSQQPRELFTQIKGFQRWLARIERRIGRCGIELDAREAQLFKTDFPNAAISSTKGATGHTLGASGAIGSVICLKAIQHQILPPCVGLQHPEYPAIDWVRESLSCQVSHALCLSFGFGGQNSAVVFGRSG